jgi:hypothetical protein
MHFVPEHNHIKKLPGHPEFEDYGGNWYKDTYTGLSCQIIKEYVEHNPFYVCLYSAEAADNTLSHIFLNPQYSTDRQYILSYLQTKLRKAIFRFGAGYLLGSDRFYIISKYTPVTFCFNVLDIITNKKTFNPFLFDSNGRNVIEDAENYFLTIIESIGTDIVTYLIISPEEFPYTDNNPGECFTIKNIHIHTSSQANEPYANQLPVQEASSSLDYARKVIVSYQNSVKQLPSIDRHYYIHFTRADKLPIINSQGLIIPQIRYGDNSVLDVDKSADGEDPIDVLKQNDIHGRTFGRKSSIKKRKKRKKGKKVSKQNTKSKPTPKLVRKPKKKKKSVKNKKNKKDNN